ncbi:hypothetical protein B0H34DRAFT_406543 [Crassisporium funariophilum]|nr:hypothetical protein B0H34DRAFT_406543 [Crassisporium funariophilum]
MGPLSTRIEYGLILLLLHFNCLVRNFFMFQTVQGESQQGMNPRSTLGTIEWKTFDQDSSLHTSILPGTCWLLFLQKGFRFLVTPIIYDHAEY